MISCDTETANGATAPNLYAGRGPRTEQGRANQIAGASAAAIAQWEKARAQGRKRLGALTPEGRAKIVAANKGKSKPPEQRGKISRAHLRVQGRKRLERNNDLVNRFAGMLTPIYEPQGASS
jgi:hypothetical protein